VRPGLTIAAKSTAMVEIASGFRMRKCYVFY